MLVPKLLPRAARRHCARVVCALAWFAVCRVAVLNYGVQYYELPRAAIIALLCAVGVSHMHVYKGADMTA